MNNELTNKSLENFFLNSNIQIDFGNFFIALILSLALSYLVKITYLKVGRALNDKDYFSDTFIPLAIITTLVITVIKFSLALLYAAIIKSFTISWFSFFASSLK